MASNLHAKPVSSNKDRNALECYADAVKQYAAIKKERPLTTEETATYKHILENIRSKMVNALEKVQEKYSTRKREETLDTFSSNNLKNFPTRCGSLLGSLPSEFRSNGGNSTSEITLESGGISKSTTDMKNKEASKKFSTTLDEQSSIIIAETESSFISRDSSSETIKHQTKDITLLTVPSSAELRVQQNRKSCHPKRDLVVPALESLNKTEWEKFPKPFSLPQNIIEETSSYGQLQTRKNKASGSSKSGRPRRIKRRSNSIKRKGSERILDEALETSPIRYSSEAKTHQVSVVVTPRRRKTEEYQVPLSSSTAKGTVSSNQLNDSQSSNSLTGPMMMSPLKQGSASFQCISQRMNVKQMVISIQKSLIAVDTTDKIRIWKFMSDNADKSRYPWNEIFTYTFPNYQTIFRTLLFTRNDEFLIIAEIMRIIRSNEIDAYYLRITAINLPLKTHTSVDLPISRNLLNRMLDLKNLPAAIPNLQSKLVVPSGDLGELVVYHFEEDWSTLISDISLPKSGIAMSAVVSVRLVENEPSLLVGTSINSVALWNTDKCTLLHSIPFPDDIAFRNIPTCISAVSPIKYVRMKAMARAIQEPIVIILVADVCYDQELNNNIQIESCQQYILYHSQLNHLTSLENFCSTTSLSTSQKCVVGCVNGTDVVLWNKNNGHIMSKLKLVEQSRVDRRIYCISIHHQDMYIVCGDTEGCLHVYWL